MNEWARASLLTFLSMTCLYTVKICFPESSRLLLESIYYSVDPESVFTMPPFFFDFIAAVNEG